jgi:exodeoxyribonuclease VII small subunit
MPPLKTLSPNIDNASRTEQNLESALRELEAILARMDKGDLPLDQLITEFENGAELVKFCRGQLDTAERRIEAVLKKLGGTDVIESLPEGEF